MTDHTLLPLFVRSLPHGAELYHIRNNSPLSRIQVVMRTGSIHEGQDCGCGLSHFLEHMLFQGCSGYPGNSASDKIHSLGGECNAYTTFDHTAYYVEVPSEKFREGADVLASMISEPLFPEEKFISEKQVIAREADMIFDRPMHLLIQQLWQGLYPHHPARMPIIGYPDKIAAVTREKMFDYYLRRYGAMRSHWIVTGDLDTDEIADFLSNKLTPFTRGNLDEMSFAPAAEPMFETYSVREFKDPLTRLALGIRSPQATEPAAPALDLLSGILGGNDSSLLVRKFLYQDELALAIDSEFEAMSFGSVLAISAACEPDKADALEQGIRAALALIRKKGISAEELAKEKLQQRLTIYGQLKSSAPCVQIVNSMRMNLGNAECLDKYLENLDAVSLDEVNAAAEKYLDPRRFVWSKVTPPAEKTHHFIANDTGKSPVKTGKTTAGIKYVMLQRNNIPLDSLSVLLPAGPVWENSCPHGCSQFLSKMLSTGPSDIAEEEFYETLDASGIDLDVSCGNNTLSLEMSFPPESRSLAENMLQKLIQSPRFSGQVFEHVRKNLIEQLQSKLLEPNFTALLHAKRNIFGSHPGGNSRLESVSDLENITPEILENFYRERLDHSLVNFGATFAPDSADAVQRNCEFFEHLSGNMKWSETALQKPVPASTDELFNRPVDDIIKLNLPREQSTVICAVAGGLAHSADYYPLLVMDSALNGLSSALFKEVREKRSLAYSTGAAVNCGIVQGIVALHAGVKAENALETIACLKAEIKRLAEDGLDENEFESARLSALSALARQLESVDAQLLHAQLSFFYGDDPQTSLNCADALRNLTREACNKSLKKIFTSSPVTAVVAGNVNNIPEQD